MPWIIDYQLVLEQMRSQHLKCLYYNSGAFGFADSTNVKTIGWIGPTDPTLRPAAAQLARPIAPPYETNLARLATQFWQSNLRGKAWIMPMSHWAFELDFANREWLVPALDHIKIDAGLLQTRNNGAAIEFSPDESEAFAYLVQRLLEMLSASDFMIAFPGQPVICTLHHHKQLWWSTADETIYAAIDAIVPHS